MRRPVSRLLAKALVRFRHLVVIGWLLMAVAVTVSLPALSETGGAKFGGLVSPASPVVRAEIRSTTQFDFPVLARAAVVQRDPAGLSVWTQARAVLRALAYDQHHPPLGSDRVLGALPVLNTAQLFPGARESGTTAITYLFTDPTASFADQERQARQWVRTHLDRPDDHFVGLTGTIPARVLQANIISRSLPWLEMATLGAILLLVGLSFRSLIAPLLVVFVAAVAYLVTVRVVGFAGEAMGFAVPGDVEPLVLALLLGVVTDYCIFYSSGMRSHLSPGADPHQAVRQTTTEHTAVIAAAGLTVAAGTGSLLVSRSEFFRAFGPALALTVLIAVVVCITLVPAALALLGRRVFWPSCPVSHSPAAAGPGPGEAVPDMPRAGGSRAGLVRFLTHAPVAAVVVAVCAGGLGFAALQARNVDLGLSIVKSLPAASGVAHAESAARQGFAPGVLSPTVLLVESPGITDERAHLVQLQHMVASAPHVAGLLGPADKVTPFVYGAVLSRGGDAARYLIVLDVDPLGATGIHALQTLQEKMPSWLQASGLDGARASFAGDTAIAESIVGATEDDLGRIVGTALAIDLLLLVLFLRALVAPLYLLAAGALSVAATVGVTTWVFQALLGVDGLTFYVPFSVAVLLVAFGADYNVLGIGPVWETGRHRPLRQAIIEAVPRSARAITTAGVTLAVSFGLLALVPLASFRQLGFAMFLGILVDALVIRTLVVPSLLVLIGRWSAWPGRGLRGRNPTPAPPVAEPTLTPPYADTVGEASRLVPPSAGKTH